MAPSAALVMPKVGASGHVEVDSDTRIYYEVYGAAGARGPLVLVHGSACALPFCADLYTALVKAGFKVLTYDARGLGRSTCARRLLTSSAMAGDMLAVVDSVLGPESRFVAAGYSLGGMIIQEAMHRLAKEGRASRLLGAYLMATSAGHRFRPLPWRRERQAHRQTAPMMYRDDTDLENVFVKGPLSDYIFSTAWLDTFPGSPLIPPPALAPTPAPAASAAASASAVAEGAAPSAATAPTAPAAAAAASASSAAAAAPAPATSAAAGGRTRRAILNDRFRAHWREMSAWEIKYMDYVVAQVGGEGGDEGVCFDTQGEAGGRGAVDYVVAQGEAGGRGAVDYVVAQLTAYKGHFLGPRRAALIRRSGVRVRVCVAPSDAIFPRADQQALAASLGATAVEVVGGHCDATQLDGAEAVAADIAAAFGGAK
ncbi:hypothetical protein HYH03_010100 [Edaphochlamys debaryana]|uniref:Serine aminopeptidase S33 domain-containing protein n=1 Tax=Edaphochlamys debaryana TaxID=47281 RepID=A0A835XXN1_9CHLO|nr:hypothetical protein HYH03_010100 [Edaphochlamys debaryana]|eukprot:KAG2491527.1 hypothetical protein HYH03_010100 [Edaphochlamys debaryana]